MENISIIGVGKLGLCFSLSLEKAGYNVTGVDVVESYVSQLNNKTFNSNEPGVNERLSECSNFTATLDLKSTLNSNTIFVIVATPSLPNGRYDHTQIDKVVEKLIKYGPRKERVELIINATTMPGYCDILQEKLKDHNLKKLLNNGLMVMVNSDDPAYFGGYINKNLIECQTALNLSKKDIKKLIINSFKSSFLTEREKKVGIEKI